MGGQWSCESMAQPPPSSDGVDDYVSFDYDAFNASDCNCTNPTHTFIPDCGCDYDYPVAVTPPIGEVLPLGLVYAFVFLVGTVGNLMVIIVVRRFKRMRNVTNYFLASLSTADLCLIWFCVPIQYMKYLSYSWFMGSFLCYSVHYVQQLTRICSVLTLTTISIERFMAIAYPMKTMWLSSIGRAKKVILLIWLSSMVLAMPTAARMDYDSFTTHRNLTAAWCIRGFSSDYLGHEELDRTYCLYQFMLLLVLPLITMTFCYTRIVHIVHVSSKNKMLQEGRTIQMMIHASKSIGLTAPAAARVRTRRESSVSFGRASNVECEASVLTPTSPKHLLPAHVSMQDSKLKMSRFSNFRRRTSRTSDSSRKQIVKMLVAIVVLYTLCWTPALLDDLLTSFQIVCDVAKGSLKQVRMIAAVLTYANSCINPIVYGFMSQNFRKTFLAACGCVATRAAADGGRTFRTTDATGRDRTGRGSGQDSLLLARPRASSNRFSDQPAASRFLGPGDAVRRTVAFDGTGHNSRHSLKGRRGNSSGCLAVNFAPLPRVSVHEPAPL